MIYNSKKSTVLICKNRATMHVHYGPSFAVNDKVIGEVAKTSVICSRQYIIKAISCAPLR